MKLIQIFLKSSAFINKICIKDTYAFTEDTI